MKMKTKDDDADDDVYVTYSLYRCGNEIKMFTLTDLSVL